MKNVTMIAHTTSDKFKNWLTKHVNVSYLNVYTDNYGMRSSIHITPLGGILSRSPSMRDWVEAGGDLVMERDGAPDPLSFGMTTIKINLTPLSDRDERLEIEMECPEHVDENFFDELLGEIARGWPETASGTSDNEPREARPVTDPTDRRILNLVTDDPDLTDQQIGLKINMRRQNVNRRRNKLKDMGHTVR